MIFVTVGTSPYKFTRLFDLIKVLARKMPHTEFIIQSGQFGYEMDIHPNIRTTNYFSFHKMKDLIKNADFVICHSGMGSILLSLMNKKKPLVIPRLKCYGEHVNDHQVTISKYLASRELVYLLDEYPSLEAAVKRLQNKITINKVLINTKQLVDYLSGLD